MSWVATPTRQQADALYGRQALIAAAAVRAVRALFRADRLAIPTRVASYQYVAARSAAQWVAGLADDVPATNAIAFRGWTSEGFPLETALSPLIEDLYRQSQAEVLASFHRLERAVASQVADAGRSAAQVEFVARPEWTNYVRLLSPPSCSRCAVLAGRVYRDLDAFQRHPGCDCVMVPVTDWESAHDAGLVSAFDPDKVSGLSKADRRAIADGADPAQVVNAVRGSGIATTGGGQRVRVTSAGVTKRGLAFARMRAAGIDPAKNQRLRPEGIYAIAGGDRARAVELLRAYGYLL